METYRSSCDMFLQWLKRRKSERAPRYYYVMQMCYRLLIRPNEIVQLRICDVDFKNGLLKIPSTVAKNHGERLLAVLEELMDYSRSIQGFPNTYYNMLTETRSRRDREGLTRRGYRRRG